MAESAAVGPVFYCLATMIIVCALGVVLARNMVHSAIALSGTLVFIGGLYLNLQADLLFGFQVLIYVGAVVTLVLFAVMLIENIAARAAIQTNRRWGIGAVAAILAAGALCWAISGSTWPNARSGLRTQLADVMTAGGVTAPIRGEVRTQDITPIRDPALRAEALELHQRLLQLEQRERGSTFDSRMRELCRALIDTYVLPFELASILLLVALAGAIVIAQQTERLEAEE